MDIVYSQAHEFLARLLREEQLCDYMEGLREYHQETYQHARRVGLLSLDLGVENDFRVKDLWHLGYAGLLHDIGKTRIPRDILEKTGGLDDQEARVMQGHVRLGVVALENCKCGLVKGIIAGHHEFTSTPYPRNGLDRRQRARPAEERRAPDTMLRTMTQIVAIADMADALVYPRPYKEAFSPEQSAEILSREFTGDHQLVDQVLRRMDGHTK